MALARAEGVAVARRGSTLCVRLNGAEHHLRWPPAQLIPKTSIPPLIAGVTPLRACPTARFGADAEVPLPGCLKPDRGQGGRGFIAFATRAEYERIRRRLTGRMVIQPLLSGTEYTATLCINGAFAVARLVARQGHRTLWRDATLRFPKAELQALLRVVRRLGVGGAGFDLMRTRAGLVVLDVNVVPALGVHRATERPRALARAYFESWIATTAPERRSG